MQMIFSSAAFLATGYHICHMQPGGLHTAQLLGMSGATWRSLDVVVAQYCLGRTLCHALDGKHWLTRGELDL